MTKLQVGKLEAKKCKSVSVLKYVICRDLQIIIIGSLKKYISPINPQLFRSSV